MPKILSLICDNVTLEDGLSIFFSNKKLTLEEELEGKQVNETQFAGMMSALGVQMIHARSSQAKGRIERTWGTLQGRLETEFSVRGITTPEQANAYFPQLIKLADQCRYWFENTVARPTLHASPDFNP